MSVCVLNFYICMFFEFAVGMVHLHRQIERNHAAKRTKSWQQSSSLGWALSGYLSGYARAHIICEKCVMGRFGKHE